MRQIQLSAALTRRDTSLQVAPPDNSVRLISRSLRDDEIRAIADATFRSDYPSRFDYVREAALIFERAGYVITCDRRITPPAVAQSQITIGNLTVDPLQYVVRCGTHILDLKHREFSLLYVLARHPDQVFSRAHLLDLAWPADYCGDDRTVDIHVSRLRRRLALCGCCNLQLVTVPSVGYKLTCRDSSDSSP